MKLIPEKIIISQNLIYWNFKRFFDVIISLTLIPLFFIVLFILLILNPKYNKGKVFYIQKRMGINCTSFNAIKFRTMVDIGRINRQFYDPLEVDRITVLGHFLRKTRLDELPQIINVIKGEMSLIGPRPEYYEHALFFIDKISFYRSRHLIRPGISGLSQIRMGYAEGLDATRRKVKIDIFYIKNAGFLLDIKIFFGTILTILKSLGK